MAMEVAAMTAGPVKNLTAIENVATDFPQAIILGCKAMNRPTTTIQLNLMRHIYIYNKLWLKYDAQH